MEQAPLAIILTVAGSSRVGEPTRVAIELRNISARPVWMVGVLDGSETGFRFPHYGPMVEGPGPHPELELPWCGMVAPLRLEDFRRLAPGEGFDPCDPVGGA